MSRGIWETTGKRSCSVCRENYLPTRKSQRVCSATCRKSKVNRLATPGDLEPRPCTRCGVVFKPKRRNSRLCRPACSGPPPREGNCAECGELFVAKTHRDKVYCGGLCRERARKRRSGARFRRYNLSLAQYEALVDAQENKCGICGEEPKNYDRYGLVVDHDHSTGEIRRLLCNRCNMGIGLFDDDPEKLKKAIEYLVAHRPA